MSTQEVITVCRLCSSNENLVWIFEKHFETTEEKLQDIIFISTGVKVDHKDVVSQKICKRCLNITIKMSQFRMTALKNDSLLKEKYEVLLKNGGLKVGNTSIKMVNETSSDQSYATKLIIHPSVRDISQEYPNLRVPKSLMKMDISPYVTMQINEVENYFKLHNRNFMKHCTEVLTPRQMKFKESTKLSEPCEKLSNINSESSEKASDVVQLTSSCSHNNISIQQPVTIKLMKTDKTEYAIVRNNEEVETNPIKCDLKRKKSPENSPSHSESSTSKKRNISESSVDYDKKGNTKANLFESLGLNTKANKTGIENEVTLEVAYVQTTLEICNICGSVQYNAKELKKHQLKHLRCQFCKNRFKTLTLKNEHLRDKCVFKETMTNLPDVKLNRVENDLELRREHPRAFTGFPPVNGLIVGNTSDENASDKVDIDSPTNKSSNLDIQMETSIIEILSDDEENLPSTSKSHQSESDCQDHLSDKIIKPCVILKNHDFLDKVSSTATDLEALNYLIKNCGVVEFSRDTSTQYPIPPNKIVQLKSDEFTTTLKGLKDHLNAYTIPVEIKHKDSHHISFNYNPQKEVKRKMCGWDDLVPIEVETPRLGDALVTASTSSHQTMVSVTANKKLGKPKRTKKLEPSEHDDAVTNVHNTSFNQQTRLPSTTKGKHERKRKNSKTANNIMSKPKKAVSIKNKAKLGKLKNDILVPVNSESEWNSTNVSIKGQTTLSPNINEEQKITQNEIQINNEINNQSKIPASNTYLLQTPLSGSTSSNHHILVSKSIDQHQGHSSVHRSENTSKQQTMNLGPIKRILIQTKPVSSTPTNASTATTSTSFSTKGTSLSNCVDRTRIMDGDNKAIKQSLTNNNILQTSSSTSGSQQTLILKPINQDKADRSRNNTSILIEKMPVSTSHLKAYKIPKISITSSSQRTSLSKYTDGNEINTMVNASQPTYSTQVPTVLSSTKNQPTPVSHSTVGNQLNSVVPGNQSTLFNQTTTSNPIKKLILVQNSPASSTRLNASEVIKSNSTSLPQSTTSLKTAHKNGVSASVKVSQQISANNTKVPITLHSCTSSHQQEPISKIADGHQSVNALQRINRPLHNHIEMTSIHNNRYISIQKTSVSSTPINTNKIATASFPQSNLLQKCATRNETNVEVNLSLQKSADNKELPKITSPIQQNLTSNSTNGNQLLGFIQDINKASNYQTTISNNECISCQNIPVSSTHTDASENLNTQTSLSKCADGNVIKGGVKVPKQTPAYNIVPTAVGSSTYSNQLNSISCSTTTTSYSNKGYILSRNIPVNSTRINASEDDKSNTTYLSQNTSLLDRAIKNEVSNEVVGSQRTDTYDTPLPIAEGSSTSSKQQVSNSTSTGGSQLISAVQTSNNTTMISSNIKNGLIVSQNPPVSRINVSEVITCNNAPSKQGTSLSNSAEPNKMNGELDLCQYTHISDVSTVDEVVPETFGLQSVKKPIILKLLDRNKKKKQLHTIVVDVETSSNTDSNSRIQGSQQEDIGKIVRNCPSRIVSTNIGQETITTPVINDGNVPYSTNKNLLVSQRTSALAPVPGYPQKNFPAHSTINSDKTPMILPTIPNSFPQFMTKPEKLPSIETLPLDKTSLYSSTERSSDYFQSTVPFSCTATVSACKTSTDVTLNNNVLDQRTVGTNYIKVKNILALK